MLPGGEDVAHSFNCTPSPRVCCVCFLQLVYSSQSYCTSKK